MQLLKRVFVVSVAARAAEQVAVAACPIREALARAHHEQVQGLERHLVVVVEGEAQAVLAGYQDRVLSQLIAITKLLLRLDHLVVCLAASVILYVHICLYL